MLVILVYVMFFLFKTCIACHTCFSDCYNSMSVDNYVKRVCLGATMFVLAYIQRSRKQKICNVGMFTYVLVSTEHKG